MTMVVTLEEQLANACAHLVGDGAVVEKLSGGYSNITLVVKGAEREIIVRTPPPGAAHIKSGHDVIREARLLEKLHPVFPRAPKPLLIVDDASVIGVPFFAMERVPGRVLRSRFMGDQVLLDIAVQGLEQPLTISVRETEAPRPGAEVRIAIDPANVLVFQPPPAETG